MIEGILRIIVYVDNMAKMVGFYRDTLGLTVNYPLVDDYSDQHWVECQAGAITLALHSGGKNSKIAGAPKIVFAVDDIHAEHQRLLDADVDMTAIQTVAPGILSADGWDIEGNLFSIDYHEH